jgi:hypothetical protein
VARAAPLEPAGLESPGGLESSGGLESAAGLEPAGPALSTPLSGRRAGNSAAGRPYRCE